MSASLLWLLGLGPLALTAVGMAPVATVARQRIAGTAFAAGPAAAFALA